MMKRLNKPARIYLTGVMLLAATVNALIGIWCLIDPASFADSVGFERHAHFVHDLGAFQLGFGVTLLLALIWADALATALAGFIVANTIHTVNHAVDLDLGGSAAQAWLLGAMSVALLGAFALRLQQLGYVLGAVTVATDRTLAPYVRQKTINLTTFRKDGTAGSSPVSIVVDGDRAYFRSFERAIKVRRLQRNPSVEFGPSTTSGKATGATHAGRVRLLSGDESRNSARLLRRKYPLLHGVLVPLAHHVLRSKFGRTVHAELTPIPGSGESDAEPAALKDAGRE